MLVLRQDEGDAPGPPQPLMGHQKLELSRRATLANRLQPDLFVSVHANDGPPRAHGPIVFIGKSPTARTLRCATEVERRLVRVMGGKARVETGDFYLLKNVRASSMLVETGFLSNAGDRAMLTNPKSRQRIARAIAGGIAAGLSAATAQNRGQSLDQD
ncbi:Cell wall hydrolase/autolysin, catalytic domain protein, partial [mine drainage metagenome]